MRFPKINEWLDNWAKKRYLANLRKLADADESGTLDYWIDGAVPFNVDAICDDCGRKGAFDFLGDYYCEKCISKDTTTINGERELWGE